MIILRSKSFAENLPAAVQAEGAAAKKGSKLLNALKNHKKLAIAATAGTAAVGAGAYAAKKIHDKKNEQKEFAENEEHKVKLSKIESHRGLYRSNLVGGLPGLVGGYKGKKYADELDEQGLSDKEILEGSKKKATQVGGRVGAALGGVTGAGYGTAAGVGLGRRIGGKKGAALGAALGAGIAGVSAATGAGMGALGARLGASKNTKTRLKKRKELEED